MEETEDAIVALPKETFVVDGKLDKEIMKPGEVVPLEDEDGNEVIGVVVEVQDQVVHVDFNHPLAGLDLHFEGVVVASAVDKRKRERHARLTQTQPVVCT